MPRIASHSMIDARYCQHGLPTAGCPHCETLASMPARSRFTFHPGEASYAPAWRANTESSRTLITPSLADGIRPRPERNNMSAVAEMPAEEIVLPADDAVPALSMFVFALPGKGEFEIEAESLEDAKAMVRATHDVRRVPKPKSITAIDPVVPADPPKAKKGKAAKKSPDWKAFDDAAKGQYLLDHITIGDKMHTTKARKKDEKRDAFIRRIYGLPKA